MSKITFSFVLCFCLFIFQGIPTLVNRQDRNYEIIFKDVKSKVQQVRYIIYYIIDVYTLYWLCYC